MNEAGFSVDMRPEAKRLIVFWRRGFVGLMCTYCIQCIDTSCLQVVDGAMHHKMLVLSVRSLEHFHIKGNSCRELNEFLIGGNVVTQLRVGTKDL